MEILRPTIQDSGIIFSQMDALNYLSSITVGNTHSCVWQFSVMYWERNLKKASIKKIICTRREVQNQ